MSEATAEAQQLDIQEFIRGTSAEGAPVVPISAQLKYNVDVVVEYLIKKVRFDPNKEQKIKFQGRTELGGGRCGGDGSSLLLLY